MKALSTTICLGLLLSISHPVLGQFSSSNQNRLNHAAGFGLAGGGGMLPSSSTRSPSALQSAIDQFKQADSDEKKQAAKEKIKAALEKQYDDFLQKDQTRVDQLFDRLKKLEAQLEKRKSAKARLVELKLEMMISQAEGLGWPTDNPFGNSRSQGFSNRPQNSLSPTPPLNRPQNSLSPTPNQTLRPSSSFSEPPTIDRTETLPLNRRPDAAESQFGPSQNFGRKQ